MDLYKILRNLPRHLLTIIALATTAYLTLMPDPFQGTHMPLFPGADKVAHGGLMFGIIGCLALDNLRSARPIRLTPPTARLMTYFVITVAIGGAIELLQTLPAIGRSCELADFISDIAGAMIGLLLSRALWHKVAAGIANA